MELNLDVGKSKANSYAQLDLWRTVGSDASHNCVDCLIYATYSSSVRTAVVVLLLFGMTSLAKAQSSPSVVLPPNSIVVNGGFESGFGGWQGTFGYMVNGMGGVFVPALEGRTVGVVIDVGSSSVGQPMWQTLNTTPGTHYFFHFSLLSGYGLVGEQSKGNLGSPVNVYWGGALFGSGGQYLGVFNNTSTTVWQTYSFEVVANSSSTIIQFIDYNDGRWQLIDAISVTPVPEPATTSLILGGLIAFGLYGLRRGRHF